MINRSQKISHIKWGDAGVFGADSGERRKLADDAAVKRFNEVWEATLSANVDAALSISREDAEEMLEDKLKAYAKPGYTYRQFSLFHVPFIVRVTSGGMCDQLWAIGTHRDNTRLCVRFDSNDELKRFEGIAAKLNWNEKQLALRLLRDFMDKFPKDECLLK